MRRRARHSIPQNSCIEMGRELFQMISVLVSIVDRGGGQVGWESVWGGERIDQRDA